MVENIKSTYFIKVILSSLDERKKLKIIKYNKSLQNLMNIDNKNYIFFSGKYITYETKKKGKEYYYINDELIYDGEYLNGERNGKGKELFF